MDSLQVMIIYIFGCRKIPLRLEERFKYFVSRVCKARIWDNNYGALFKKLQAKAALLLDEMAIQCDLRFEHIVSPDLVLSLNMTALIFMLFLKYRFTALQSCALFLAVQSCFNSVQIWTMQAVSNAFILQNGKIIQRYVFNGYLMLALNVWS
jgi:hypothetical protein